MFDFILVLLSVASVAVDFGTSQDLSFMPLLRVLRVARIFRLIPKAKGLRCARPLRLHPRFPAFLPAWS